MFSIGSSFPRSPTSDGVRSFTRRRKRNIIRTVSRKRAHVSGMLCDLKRRAEAQRRTLAAIDETLKLFSRRV